MPDDRAEHRDPRVDPKAGDVLSKGRDIRDVHQVRDAFVEVHTVLVYQGANWLYPTLWQYRKWAKNAKVIYRAE